MEYLVVIAYLICLLLIFLFSLNQLHLTWHYLTNKKETKNNTKLTSERVKSFPSVTVQLPVFNELYVVERLIDAVAAFDYPKQLLEIQVLDDSTDETVSVIEKKVEAYQSQGINIKHIRRSDRKGFKAGALQYGLERAHGEFITIFDADFLPEKDFLLNTIGNFDQENIGLVQTRWGHINENYSTLTKLQAFGLDAHFSVEQDGRSHAGSFINFNGTAGVWRKQCILDAGGWSADTLTEDLDLSYRAQMKGWKFKFLEDVVAPAELPVLMPAIKSQQFRWNKGAAETAKKNLGKVLKTKVGFVHKIHAIFHLLNSSVFVCLLFAALLSIPMLFIKDANPKFNHLFNLGSIFLIGFFSIAYFYWIASKSLHPIKSGIYYLKTFPVFITVSMGLSLHNAVAVMEGFLGFKSPFIRTPKYNIAHSSDRLRKNKYISSHVNPLTILEGFLGVYFLFGIAAGIYLLDLGLIVFHTMLAFGFVIVFYHSIKKVKYG